MTKNDPPSSCCERAQAGTGWHWVSRLPLLLTWPSTNPFLASRGDRSEQQHRGGRLHRHPPPPTETEAARPRPEDGHHLALADVGVLRRVLRVRVPDWRGPSRVGVLMTCDAWGNPPEECGCERRRWARTEKQTKYSVSRVAPIITQGSTVVSNEPCWSTGPPSRHGQANEPPSWCSSGLLHLFDSWTAESDGNNF